MPKAIDALIMSLALSQLAKDHFVLRSVTHLPNWSGVAPAASCSSAGSLYCVNVSIYCAKVSCSTVADGLGLVLGVASFPHAARVSDPSAIAVAAVIRVKRLSIRSWRVVKKFSLACGVGIAAPN